MTGATSSRRRAAARADSALRLAAEQRPHNFDSYDGSSRVEDA